jgi:hypothetical protein
MASEECALAIEIVIGETDPVFGHGLGCGARIASELRGMPSCVSRGEPDAK